MNGVYQFCRNLPRIHRAWCVLSCRSALDELAGRGGRGPEDDPLRLTTRGLLQFFRARGREKSLAAAPADLLPASAVCQVREWILLEK